MTKRSYTMNVDLEDGELANKGISIDDEVVITVKGKVKSLDAKTPPEKNKKGEVMWEGRPASMSVVVSDAEVQKAGSQIEEFDKGND